MKRVLALLLVFVLMAGTACNSKTPEANSNTGNQTVSDSSNTSSNDTSTNVGSNDTSTSTNSTEAPVADVAPVSDAPYWMSEDFDPFGKYDETVHITQNRVLASWMAFDEGDDEDNNWWTRTYKEQLNVEVTNLFTADDWGTPLDTLVNMAIATDDLPDAMYLYTTLAVRVMQGNKAMDITDLFEYTASDQVKSIYEKDPDALAAWTQGGRKYGLANAASPVGWTYFWTPQSLIDKLNDGVVPVTYDEIIAYAEKVRDHTGGYAFSMNNTLNTLNNLGHIVGSTGAWIERDGELVWGKVQPEHKAMWSILADWYAKGLLARDFANKEDADVEADFLNNRFGIIIDGTNVPHGSMGRNWKSLNPDDELVAIPMVSPDGSKTVITSAGSYGDAFMISAKAKDPAAIMRAFNLTTAVFADADKPDFVVDSAYNSGASGGWATFWCALAFGAGKVDDRRLRYQPGYRAYQAILDGSDGSELRAARSFEAVTAFDNINSWINEGTSGENWEEKWAFWSMWFGAKSWPHTIQLHDEGGRFVTSPRKGQEVEAEARENQNLYAKHIEYATMSIMNNTVDKGFDEWVEYFYNNGGNEIVAQVNEQYKNQ